MHVPSKALNDISAAERSQVSGPQFESYQRKDRQAFDATIDLVLGHSPAKVLVFYYR